MLVYSKLHLCNVHISIILHSVARFHLMNITTASFVCEVSKTSIKSHVATRHSSNNQAITQLLDRRRDDAKITELAGNLGVKNRESSKKLKSVLLTFS